MIALYNTADEIAQDATLPDLGLPYLYQGSLSIFDLDGLTAPTWTIQAGVTLWIDAISVGYGPGNSAGNLVIEGSAADPVILTSPLAAPQAGDWGGIFFNSGLFDPAISKIDYAQVLYAGNTGGQGVAACGSQRHGAVTIDGNGQYDGPTITNTLIAHSASAGIASASSDTGTVMLTDYSQSGNTFQDNAGPDQDSAACP